MLVSCVTCAAGLKLSSPARSAATVHVPAVTIVTVLPDTVQTSVVSDENAVTASSDVDVALTGNGALPNVCAGTGSIVIVWFAFVIVAVWLASLHAPDAALFTRLPL